MESLRLCSYYKGSAFRGLRNYQNKNLYQIGKIVQLSEICCISKNQLIAQNFSNNEGMIMEFDQRSSKDIEELSIQQEEQEVILPPFSQFQITDVLEEQNKPIFVKLKEIPQPRWFKVILWVDDNPQNNYFLAEELEREYPDISIVFCISTEEAINMIHQNKWMIYLDKQNLRIVTDMVREENGVLNYSAGIEFIYHMIVILNLKNEILLYCGNKQQAQENCKKKNLFGDFKISNQIEDLGKFIRFL